MAQIHPDPVASGRGAAADVLARGQRQHTTADALCLAPDRAAIVATGWVARQSKTLLGFFTLRLPSGIVLHDCSLHESGDRRWVGLPNKPQIDQDGQHRVDERGKRLYSPCVEIPDRATRDRFQALALAAVDRLLAGEEHHRGSVPRANVSRRGGRPLITPPMRPDSLPMPDEPVSDRWPR
jgi:hypothetical protein